MNTTLKKCQDAAQEATNAALKEYERIPDEWNEALTLGSILDGNDWIFELYVPAESPADATIISSARVNSETMQVDVVISNLRKLNS